MGVEDHHVRLVVSDDGCGISVASRDASAPESHLGFAISRRRVDDVGGALIIDPASSAGTTITALLPVV